MFSVMVEEAYKTSSTHTHISLLLVTLKWQYHNLGLNLATDVNNSFLFLNSTSFLRSIAFSPMFQYPPISSYFPPWSSLSYCFNQTWFLFSFWHSCHFLYCFWVGPLLKSFSLLSWFIPLFGWGTSSSNLLRNVARTHTFFSPWVVFFFSLLLYFWLMVWLDTEF